MQAMRQGAGKKGKAGKAVDSADAGDAGGGGDESLERKHTGAGDAWLAAAPAALRQKIGRLETDYVNYNDRDTHQGWVRFYVGKGDFLTADSVVEQMLALQEEAAASVCTDPGLSDEPVVADLAAGEKADWQEQEYNDMIAQEEQDAAS